MKITGCYRPVSANEEEVAILGNDRTNKRTAASSSPSPASSVILTSSNPYSLALNSTTAASSSPSPASSVILTSSNPYSLALNSTSTSTASTPRNGNDHNTNSPASSNSQSSACSNQSKSRRPSTSFSSKNIISNNPPSTSHNIAPLSSSILLSSNYDDGCDFSPPSPIQNDAVSVEIVTVDDDPNAENVNNTISFKEDDDVIVVDPQDINKSNYQIMVTTPTKTKSLTNNEDDEIEIMGTKNALSLPHMRAHCTEHKFVSVLDSNKYNVTCCSMCYCFVCDTPVKECSQWSLHCNARLVRTFTLIFSRQVYLSFFVCM